MEIIKELKEAADNLGRSFEEYKKVNDERIEKLAKGEAVAELEEKLERVNAGLDNFSGLKTRLEELEAKYSNPSNDPDNPDRQKSDAIKLLKGWLAHGAKTQELYDLAVKSGIDVKAVNVTTGADGGVAVPEVIANMVMQEVVDISPIRSIARVVQVSTNDYKELVDVRGATSGWVGEATARTETNTPQLQEVAPTFGEIYAEPRATQWALDDLFFNVEQWLRDSVSTEFARAEGAAFVSGDGTNQPTGFLDGTPVTTADSSRGFGVLQYVPGGSAAALDNPDPFITLVYTLKAAYRSNARFVTSRLSLAAMRKLKDDQSQYLWVPGLEKGQSSMFLGYPITEAEDMPAIAADSFSVAFGDFRRGYLIADRVGMRMLRDPYTTKPYIKFYTTKRVGGILKDDNAIKLLKTATS